MQIEKRSISSARASSTDNRQLIGYGARYGEVTQLTDELRETILPGAFASCISRGDDVRLLRDHDASRLLARTRSGTMVLEADSAGLRFSTSSLPNIELANETLELVKRGDLSGCSFSFSLGPNDDTYTRETDRVTGKQFVLRSIRNFSCCYDVSLCSFPQYSTPEVSARVAAEARAFAQKSSKFVSEKERNDIYRRYMLQRLHEFDREIRG